MNEDLKALDVITPEVETFPLTVIARTREEMAQAQSHIVEFLARKLAFEQAQLADLEENLATCKKNGWRTSTLIRQVGIKKETLTYYEKVKAAAEQGYAIIPDFPVTLFAIRTDRKKPLANANYDVTYDQFMNDRVNPSNLPVGVGRYVGDRAFRTQTPEREEKHGDRLIKVSDYENKRFNPVEFPMVKVKPQIMTEAAVAMKALIFDEIGIFEPGTARKNDPILVGKVKGPTTSYRQRRTTCFLLAWFLDLDTL